MKTFYKTILCLISLMVCVLGIVFFSYYRITVRNMDNIGNYIKELSHSTSEHVGDVLRDKNNTIQSIACLYGTSISSPEADLQLLAELETTSGFDWIRFIDPEGVDYASDGVIAQVSDRPYFREGIAGKGGTFEVLESRVSGEKLIGFSSPVYYEGKIIGLIVGFLNQQTISDILKTELFGYAADTMILREDGVVLGRYQADGTLEKETFGELIGYVRDEERQSVLNAVSDRTQMEFSFSGPEGDSKGYLVPVKDTEWSLLQMFPAEAANEVKSRDNQDAMVVLSLMLLVAGVFSALLFGIYREERRMETANEQVEHKTSMDLIVSAARTVYPMIMEENLTCNKVRIICNQGIVRCGFVVSVSVDEMIEGLRCTMPYEEEYRSFCSTFGRQALLRAYEEGKHELIGRLRQTGDDGKIHWMEIRNILLENVSGDIYSISMVRCVDEEIAMTLELERAKNEAESSSKAKTMFLLNMSHDIRTPMNAILGFAGLALKNPEDSRKVALYLRKIELSGKNLLDLINNVLEMARIEQGTEKADLSVYSLKELARSCVIPFEDTMKRKQLSFHWITKAEHEQVFMDAAKVRQILMNILSNAVKYTPDHGSIRVSVQEGDSVHPGVSTYSIIVEDTGIGISSEFLPHIFEQFERERSVTENGIEGTGLGMAIVKKTVQLLNGTIHVESEPGKGTTVTVRLPLQIVDENTVRTDTAEQELPFDTAVFSGKRILLAEDNELNAEIAMEILTQNGFQVEWAKDGIICVDMVEKAKAGYYDLILMDIQMPNMNGYRATRLIRSLADQKKAAIPILAMTANAFDRDRKQALACGMDGFITKPLDLNQLLLELKRVILRQNG